MNTVPGSYTVYLLGRETHFLSLMSGMSRALTTSTCLPIVMLSAGGMREREREGEGEGDGRKAN